MFAHIFILFKQPQANPFQTAAKLFKRFFLRWCKLEYFVKIYQKIYRKNDSPGKRSIQHAIASSMLRCNFPWWHGYNRHTLVQTYRSNRYGSMVCRHVHGSHLRRIVGRIERRRNARCAMSCPKQSHISVNDRKKKYKWNNPMSSIFFHSISMVICSKRTSKMAPLQ